MLEDRIRTLLSKTVAELEKLAQLPFQVKVMRTDLVEQSAIDIIQESQLAIGEDSEGEDLGTYRNFAYKNRYRPVDLHDTGSFYRKMYASATSGGSFYTSSSDAKNRKLELKYGENIHGVAEKNFPEWFPDIRLAYVLEVRKVL